MPALRGVVAMIVASFCIVALFTLRNGSERSHT